MSSLFWIFRRRRLMIGLSVILAALLLYVGYALLFTPPSVDPEGTIRLTRGHFRDDTLRINAEGTRAIFVRQLPGERSSGDIREGDQDMESRIVELDFRNPKRASEDEIEGLRGANWPSFLGSDAFVALNPQGRLIVLERGEDTPRELVLRQFAGRPAKPVGSPDGTQIAFLASAFAQKEGGAELADLNIFRYEVYVVSASGGIPRAITKPFTKSARLVAVEWADNEAVNVTYQLLERRDDLTRVERVQVADGSRRLALFLDFPTPVSLPSNAMFLATTSREAHTVLFVWRDDSREARHFLGAELFGVWLAPAGTGALVARYAEDTNGINLYLVEVPKLFLDPPPKAVPPPAAAARN